MNFKKSLFLFWAIIALFLLPLFAAEQSESLNTPGLRIEFLQSEIERWTYILTKLKASEERNDVLIAQAIDKIKAFKEHKQDFEALQTECIKLDEEEKSLWNDWRPGNANEIRALIQLNAECKEIWFKRVSERCEALDAIIAIGGKENLNAPFFLKGINFLHISNLIQLDDLAKNNFGYKPIPLSCITGNDSDAVNSIFQLKVVNQSNENGGSASCGYQALKNCIILCQAALCATDDQMRVLQNLMSVQLIRLLFGHSSSPWRSKVIIIRKKALIIDFIKNVLLVHYLAGNKPIMTGVSGLNAISSRPIDREFCVKVRGFNEGQWISFEPYSQEWLEEGYEDKIRAAYISLIPEIATMLASAMEIQAVQTAPIEITTSQLMKAFADVVNAKIAKGSTGLSKAKTNLRYKQDREIAQQFSHKPYKVMYELLKDEDLIRKYFTDIDKVKFLINTTIRELNSGINFNQQIFDSYISSGNFGAVGFAGEWAAQEELKEILREEMTNGLLQISKANGAEIIPFFAGDGNISFKGTLGFEIPAYYDYEKGIEMPARFEYEENFSKIRTILADEKSHVVIPIMLHLPGHWITLVINKVGKSKQYIIADSLNDERIGSNNLIELIALLEGIEEPVAVSISTGSASSSNATPLLTRKRKETKQNADSGYCIIS